MPLWHRTNTSVYGGLDTLWPAKLTDRCTMCKCGSKSSIDEADDKTLTLIIHVTSSWLSA